MEKIVLFTDSCVDLPEEIIKKHNIQVVPFTVTIDEKAYLDGVDITYKKVWEIMKKDHILPKTACGSPKDYSHAWKPFLNEGYDIIYCGIGSHLSNGFNAARIAKEDCDKENKIYLVDSNNLSSSIGLLLLKASELIDKGMSAEFIANTMIHLSKHLSAQFTVDDLEFLFKGGRCSGMSYLLSKALKIHPILKVYEDGYLRMQTKVRGSALKACEFMLDEMKEKIDTVDPSYIAVTGVSAQESIDYIAGEVKKMIPNANVIKCDAGTIISCHCGPGTVGLLYFVND